MSQESRYNPRRCRHMAHVLLTGPRLTETLKPSKYDDQWNGCRRRERLQKTYRWRDDASKMRTWPFISSNQVFNIQRSIASHYSPVIFSTCLTLSLNSTYLPIKLSSGIWRRWKCVVQHWQGQTVTHKPKVDKTMAGLGTDRGHFWG